MRVGVLGAWSIDNPGDAVIGWATRQALRARLPTADVVAFAPRLPGGSWGHDFSRTRGIDDDIIPVPVDDFGWTRNLDALVVGGGGIIIPEPGFDTFLLEERWNGPPAAWNAVCSQSTPAAVVGADRRRRVRRTCQQLAYVSVRNTTTATFLRQCGFEGSISVVPDPAFGDLGVAPAETRPGFPIGLSLGATLLEPRAATFYATLFDALDELTRGPRAATTYLVPFGTVYGDGRAQRAAAERLPGCRILNTSDPIEAWRAIGRMRLHIGGRLHAIIAACTQGVPFLALDEYFSEAAGTSKIRDLLIDADLGAYGVCPTVDHDPTPTLDRALALADSATQPFAALLAHKRARLAAHWDAMVLALGLRSATWRPADQSPQPSST